MTRPASHDRLVVMAPKCFACPEGDRLRWTDRLDIICLGRCSNTNQVSSVSLSVFCRQTMNISPVTQKKKSCCIIMCCTASSPQHLHLWLCLCLCVSLCACLCVCLSKSARHSFVMCVAHSTHELVICLHETLVCANCCSNIACSNIPSWISICARVVMVWNMASCSIDAALRCPPLSVSIVEFDWSKSFACRA